MLDRYGYYSYANGQPLIETCVHALRSLHLERRQIVVSSVMILGRICLPTDIGTKVGICTETPSTDVISLLWDVRSDIAVTI